ncbi:MAG: hypothetical protein AAB909_00500, partial [Patescibacteria group bacterium]
MVDQYKPYNPENMSPQVFLQPPTKVVQLEADYLATQVAKSLAGAQTGGGIKRRLGVGTELEVYFFSPEVDPVTAKAGPAHKNPNYGESHSKKVAKIRSWAEELAIKKGGSNTDLGRIGIEFRTSPKMDVVGYHSDINTIRDGVGDISQSLGVLPIVHSQHIHISLLREKGNIVYRGMNRRTYDFKELAKQRFEEVYPL